LSFKNYICVFYERKNEDRIKKPIYRSIIRSTSLSQARADCQNEFNIFAENQNIEKFSEELYVIKIFNLENYVDSIPNEELQEITENPISVD
jgi:hypothetical protein